MLTTIYFCAILFLFCNSSETATRNISSISTKIGTPIIRSEEMSLVKYFNRSASNGARRGKRACILTPMEADYSAIELSAGRNVVGRSKETGIRDTRCSKRQLELDVDLETSCVKMRVLGTNPCSVNGLMAMPNAECELQHGDIIELVYGRHQYEVLFKPPPSKSTEAAKMKINTDGEEKATNSTGTWDIIENNTVFVYTSTGVKASEKIAAYDMDGTIITTKSGNVFPKHADDWRILYPEVPKKLKTLHDSGYKICIFTNQGGIANGKVKLDDFKRKVVEIIKRLGVPVQVFATSSDGYYRKPLPGMWEYLEKHKNCDLKINKTKSFYVGDAAGRPESGTGSNKRRKDHSLADRHFAANIGIAFYTPEEHFLGLATEHWLKSDFEPSEIESQPMMDPEITKQVVSQPEMVIMVGLPGSGKSHFCKEYFVPLSYTIASADTLGNTQACLKACEKALIAGKSCVVDNTNVDVEARKKFVELAKKLNIPCRCFVMNVTLTQVRHNIKFRQLTDSAHSKINEMLLNMMKKKYTAPTLEEGYTQIVKVNFKPRFNSTKEEQLYKLYLLEK